MEQFAFDALPVSEMEEVIILVLRGSCPVSVVQRQIKMLPNCAGGSHLPPSVRANPVAFVLEAWVEWGVCLGRGFNRGWNLPLDHRCAQAAEGLPSGPAPGSQGPLWGCCYF